MPTAMARTNPRTAEFARLFDLFDRIATRRARGSTELAISMDDIAAVPTEFAPVLKNLSTILSIRAQRDQERFRSPIGRPRRTTLAIAPSLEDSTMGVVEVENATFPLEEHHPFTFKLMLHKLYDVDEWAEKVKSAVEESKEQFKPLAERMQEVVRETTGKERAPKRGVGRPRSMSIFNPKSKAKAVSREKTPPSPPPANEFSRVLKKRCVGRRKSISEPLAGGVWVYDAAISAIELDDSPPSLQITFSKSKHDTDHTWIRSRHQSLAGLDMMQDRDTCRRKVRIAMPMMRDDAPHSALPGERGPGQQMKRPLDAY